EQLTAVSNMPVQRETRLAGGRKEVAFDRSVSMPTYLVALYVGELDYLEDSDHADRPLLQRLLRHSLHAAEARPARGPAGPLRRDGELGRDQLQRGPA